MLLKKLKKSKTKNSEKKQKINAFIILSLKLEELSCVLIFNIIITNKKRTAIAPTYIIIKIKPKNSTLNINKIAAALQNVKIKKITDCTGFFEKATENPEFNKIKQKSECKKSIKIKYQVMFFIKKTNENRT